MYDDHLRLTGKCVVDFLLELIELFSLGVIAEALRANINTQQGQFVCLIQPRADRDINIS